MTDSNCLPMMLEKELLRSVSIVNDELENETTSQQQQYQNEDEDALAVSATISESEGTIQWFIAAWRKLT